MGNLEIEYMGIKDSSYIAILLFLDFKFPLVQN